MNRRTHLLAGLAFATVGCVTAMSSAQIIGSAHDFSAAAWSDGQICKPCHTPHNAISGMPRLWNHELTVATYTMHGGSSGTAEVNFDLKSRLCLSCHDGTVALDSFGGVSGSTMMQGDANLGTDLQNDHPVGSSAQYPPTPTPSWWWNSFKDPTLLPSSLRLQDWVNQSGETKKVIGCTTCHNPHRRGGFDHMLTMTNSASALCLGCHIK